MDEECIISRTQKKKEATALQKTGEKLVALSGEQLKKVDLPSILEMAIKDIRSMKSHGARRRQMQYIGSLMRKLDVTPIERALSAIEQGAYGEARAFHRLEDWRDRLVAGDDQLLRKILGTHPNADRQRLGQLVRNARKEKEKQSPPKSARNLFRYLKELTAPCKA